MNDTQERDKNPFSALTRSLEYPSPLIMALEVFGVYEPCPGPLSPKVEVHL